MRNPMPKIIPPFVLMCGTIAVWFWLGEQGSHGLEKRVAVADKISRQQPTNFPGQFRAAATAPAIASGGNWPNFRGPAFDAVCRDPVSLARTWPVGGPKILWKVECGQGHAGAAVKNGKVYLLDYDEKFKADVLRCLSLADGGEIWRRWYNVDLSNQHGMSRTIPAVTDNYVLTIGPKMHVMCCRADSGDFIWGIDLVNEYGSAVPDWYGAQCPLIDNGRAIIAPAGSSLMIAVDCETGKVVWRTANPKSWGMTHNSILPVEIDGVRQYVYCAGGGVAGVSAGSGELLWNYDRWTVPTANVPMPVHVGEGRFFLSGGYGAGSMMLKVERRAGKFAASEEFRLKKDVFGSEQQTPIFHDGYIYGVLSNDSGTLKKQMVCLDLSGKRIWASGSEDRFGKSGGPYVIADGLLLAMYPNEAGDENDKYDNACVLSMSEASPAGYRRLGRFKVLAGHDAWAPMALADGRLILRDVTTLVCLDLRAESYK